MEQEICKNLNKHIIDLTGKRFGKLLVIGLDHNKQVIYKNGRKRVTYFWKCACDCGNEVVRSGNSLRGGYSMSCGCQAEYKRKMTYDKKKKLQIKSNTNMQDLTGKIFGKLLVIALDHKKQVTYKNGKKKTYYYWKCACECGNEVIRCGESLRKGATKSCGCYKFYKQMLTQEKKKYLKQQKENEEEFE